MRPLQHRLVIDRAAQRLRKLRRLGESVAHHDFMTGDDDRPLRVQQPQGKGTQALVRWAHARVDPRRLPKIDRTERVQDVARQRDKDRSCRRCRGHLGGAVNDPWQVFEPCDLGRPLHDRCGDRHQGGIQQRLGQPMSLLLLSCRHDERGAGIESRKQRTHGVAKSWRNMNVACDQLPGRPSIAVSHRDDDRLLQAQHVAHLRIVGERMHDRQLGCSGVAKEVSDTLRFEQLDERAAAADRVRR